MKPLEISVRGIVIGALCGASPASAFEVQALTQFGPAHVAVAFTDSVDIATALRLENYTFVPQGGAPAIAPRSVQLQDNQRTVVIVTGASLAPAASYGVTVADVSSRHGDPLSPGGPSTFTTVSQTVTGIADVHANINALIGQTVTLVGQVYIRPSTVTGTGSGFLQDGTGRGLNLFGNPPVLADVDSITHVVRVTGTVELYFTTVELTNYTATLLAARMPPLAPRVLTVAQASSPQWEGTYIRTTATLLAPPTPSGSSHYAYAAMDAGQLFTFRVRNATGIDPLSFAGNEVVTGAGAGTQFQSNFQVTVGNAFDFYEGTGPGDLTPPALVSASGEGGGTSVTVEFSEPVGAGANVPGNYAVYPQGQPGSAVGVTAARVTGSTVTLTLAAALAPGAAYTVSVSGVFDFAGNPIAANSSLTFTTTIPLPFGVAAVFPFGEDRIGVAYTKAVNAAQATQAGNYTFVPALEVAALGLQENGRTVILRTASAPAPGAAWQVSVAGVASATGEALAGGGPFPFQFPAEPLTSISTIQADPASFSGQTVTVVGQVTIPVGSRGGTPSGYVQDGSGRGLNLFGGSIQGAVNQLGSVAKVTGTVTPYFSTTEITDYTATAIASGLPHLGAKPLAIGQSNSSAWEGTYIECTGTLTAIGASGTSNMVYTATDGAAFVDFRVGNGLGIPPSSFLVGDRVTGRGAGGAYQSTWQVNVGNLDDFFLAGGGGVDTIGPVPVSASGDDGSPLVTVNFSEPLRTNEATLPDRYTVTAGGPAGTPVAVTQVVLSANGRSVRLALAEALRGSRTYVVAINELYDLSGNVSLPGASVSFVAVEAAPGRASLVVPARTLMRGFARQGELMPITLAAVPGSQAVCRVFDTQGRLVRVLFDGVLSGNGRRALTWDARDEAFEYVPAGLYVCHAEATDPAGRITDARAPIVVAVRLR